MSARQPRLLGIAASLRNARWGAGNRRLTESLLELRSREELDVFLKEQSELHLKNFIDAGRKERKQFEEIYRNLRKSNGEVGLSNSEVALSSALWAAHREGADVHHLSLAEYFTAGGNTKNEAGLREALLAADGILVSGPVYFGDRGSLADSLLEFIRDDDELRRALRGRLYGGIAVGAKRNGGQETTLIYQMMDMLDLGLLAVGNDSDTTAQYGGTCHAGDVGTAHSDTYGIDTSIGVGRRMAKILVTMQSEDQLADTPRVLFLVLQDKDGVARSETMALVKRLGPRVRPTVLDLSQREIKRCIACDICPTHVDVDGIYRCIIKSANDAFPDLHADLLRHDMIVPVVASARSRGKTASNYQTFIERTRYLRRGDYVWSDILVAPISMVDFVGHDTYLLRMVTSFLRHHTVMAQPMTGHLVDHQLANLDEIVTRFLNLLPLAERLTAGRLARARSHDLRYRPVGYVLSADKDVEDEKMRRRAKLIEDRSAGLEREARMRLLRDIAEG